MWHLHVDMTGQRQAVSKVPGRRRDALDARAGTAVVALIATCNCVAQRTIWFPKVTLADAAHPCCNDGSMV